MKKIYVCSNCKGTNIYLPHWIELHKSKLSIYCNTCDKHVYPVISYNHKEFRLKYGIKKYKEVILNKLK